MTDTKTPMDVSIDGRTHPGPESTVDVLYVDEDPTYVDLAVQLLERRHQSVRATGLSDTTKALDWLDREPVDCVVCGHHPPRLDGVAFVRRLGRTRPDVPVLLFTPDVTAPLVEEALDAGAVDVLRRDTAGCSLTLLANRAVEAAAARNARQRARRLDHLLEATVRDLSLLECWRRLGSVAFDSDLQVLEHAGDAPSTVGIGAGVALADCFEGPTWERLAPNCRAALGGEWRRLTISSGSTKVRVFTRPRSAGRTEGVLLVRELAVV
ncbi:response regulator [Haloarchaeobius sp. DT45]|uniref:response regulator n=1 Tax=Haloarchaeobius sp. DT45 TaxID=3446116 RepID=UPI003F6CB6AB